MDHVKLLEQWQRGLRIAHKAHQKAAVKFESQGRWLGVAAVITSTIVGTSLFADANATVSQGWKIGAGVLSLVAAVLSAVQGILKYGEIAALHRAAAQRYGPLRREVEELLAEVDPANPIAHQVVAGLRKRWDEIDADSPSVPQKIYDDALASLTPSPASVPPPH